MPIEGIGSTEDIRESTPIITEENALEKLAWIKNRIKYIDTDRPSIDEDITYAREIKQSYENNTSLFWKIFNKLIPFKTNRDRIQTLFAKIENYDRLSSPSLAGRLTKNDNDVILKASGLGYLGEADPAKAKAYLFRLATAYADYERKKNGQVPQELLTPTLFGSKVDREKILEYLIEAQFDSDFMNWVLDHEDLAERNTLIDLLALKLDAQTPPSFAQVQRAIQTNNKHILNLAKATGYNWSGRDLQKGGNALHAAALYNKPEMAALILQMEPYSINIRNEHERTPVEEAWYNGKVAVFRELIANGITYSLVSLLQNPLNEERIFKGDYEDIIVDPTHRTFYTSDVDEMILIALKSDHKLDLSEIENPYVRDSLVRIIKEAIKNDDVELIRKIIVSRYSPEEKKASFEELYQGFHDSGYYTPKIDKEFGKYLK